MRLKNENSFILKTFEPTQNITESCTFDSPERQSYQTTIKFKFFLHGPF